MLQKTNINKKDLFLYTALFLGTTSILKHRTQATFDD